MKAKQSIADAAAGREKALWEFVQAVKLHDREAYQVLLATIGNADRALRSAMGETLPEAAWGEQQQF